MQVCFFSESICKFVVSIIQVVFVSMSSMSSNGYGLNKGGVVKFEKSAYALDLLGIFFCTCGLT